MSKMSAELERRLWDSGITLEGIARRLDANKYELLKVCKEVHAILEVLLHDHPFLFPIIYERLGKVINAIEKG